MDDALTLICIRVSESASVVNIVGTLPSWSLPLGAVSKLRTEMAWPQGGCALLHDTTEMTLHNVTEDDIGQCYRPIGCNKCTVHITVTSVYTLLYKKAYIVLCTSLCTVQYNIGMSSITT